jgi:capsular polysaccharide transport system ATP-binding protein
MIRLDTMSYAYFRGKTVFDGVSIELPSHRRMAVLGGPETGKTTLIGLLSGVVDPTGGRIERFAHLSFPAGYSRAFRMPNSVRQNVTFAARIYDADPDEVIDFIGGIIDLDGMMDRPMRDLAVPTRLAVAFALTYALPFDTYLFDNIIGPGDPATRDLWRTLYEARTAQGGAILATRQPRVAEAYCDCALVLRRNAQPVFFDTIGEAVALFEEENGAARKAAAAAAPAAAADSAQPETGAAQAVAKAGE